MPGRLPPTSRCPDASMGAGPPCYRRPVAALPDDLAPDGVAGVELTRDSGGSERPGPADAVDARGVLPADQAAGHRAAARHHGPGDGPRRGRAARRSWLIAAVLVGGALAAGGANTINCWIERDRDQLMRRTHGRPLPAGDINPTGALVFGLVLEVAGVRAALGDRRTCSSAALAVSATLFYVFVYTIWLKPRSTQNIVIGGAAGAVPVLVGWAAVTGVARRAGVGAVRDRLLLDAAALLGAVAPLPRRLRRGRHPDAAGRAGHPGGAPARSSAYAFVVVAVTLAARRSSSDARLGSTPRRRGRARRGVRRPGDPRCSGDPHAGAGDQASSRSRTSTSRCCSPPLPSTPSSAPSDAARRARVGIGTPRRSSAVLVARGRSRWSRRSAPTASDAGDVGTGPDARSATADSRRSASAAPDFDARRARRAGTVRLADFRGQAGRRELLGVVVHPVPQGVPAVPRGAGEVPGRRPRRSSAITFRDLTGDARALRRRTQRATWDLVEGGDGDPVGRGLRRARDPADVLHRPRRRDRRPLLRRARPATASTTRSARSPRPDAGLLLPAEEADRGERCADRPDQRARRARRPGTMRRAGRARRARSPTSAAAGSALANDSSASGSRSSGYAMPPRNSSTRNSPLATARFASARSVPAMSMPMPANATVPISSSPSAGRIAGR